MQTETELEPQEDISEVQTLKRPGWGQSLGLAGLLVVLGACAGALVPLGGQALLPGLKALAIMIAGGGAAYGLKRALGSSGPALPRFGAVLGALGGLALILMQTKALAPALWGAISGAAIGMLLLFRRAYLEQSENTILEQAQEAFSLHAAGEVEAAEKLLSSALNQSQRRLGTKHETSAALQHSMANLMRLKRGYTQAEKLYQLAVTGYQHRLGSSHPSLPGCLQDVCQLYIAWEKVDEGVRVAEQALALKGVDTLATARTLTLLASLMTYSGRYDEAIEQCRKAFRLQREKRLSTTHPDVVLTLTTLSDCLIVRQSWLESEEYLSELIQGLKSAQEPNPHQLLKAYLSLADVLVAQDKLIESGPVFAAALELLQGHVGPVEKLLDAVLKGYSRLASIPGQTVVDPKTQLLLVVYRGERSALSQALHDDPSLLQYRDASGWGLTHWACFFGYEDMVRSLIQSGAVWKGPERDGSAVHVAVRWNRLKVLEEMLRAGATVDETDVEGATPLLVAAIHGRLGAAELLIQAQADPNRPDRSGRLPLLEAVRKRRLSVVAGLIAAGAEVSTPGPEGRTALHLAAELGLAEMAECLLINGGRADQADSRGETALDLARRHRHRRVLQTLRRLSSIKAS